jgi:hypothetical protein
MTDCWPQQSKKGQWKTIYRRHAKDCSQSQDRYAPRCGCPLWLQFNRQKPSTVFNGNKLRQGQNKRAAGTRIWSEAQANARKLEKELEDCTKSGPEKGNSPEQSGGFRWRPNFSPSLVRFRISLSTEICI